MPSFAQQPTASQAVIAVGPKGVVVTEGVLVDADGNDNGGTPIDLTATGGETVLRRAACKSARPPRHATDADWRSDVNRARAR